MYLTAGVRTTDSVLGNALRRNNNDGYLWFAFSHFQRDHSSVPAGHRISPVSAAELSLFYLLTFQLEPERERADSS
jgi:hypothetical protein